MIKTLLFDFGDVFLNLDKAATFRELNKLGLHDFSSEMIRQNQLYEMGKISSEEFVDFYLQRLPENSSKTLINAWNAILLDLPEHRLQFLQQLKAEHNVELIIVDYIQLLNSGGKVESRQQEISFISRSLKALAKDLNIPILALSQLSRAVENRTDHRPIMSDLRESGAIEQDADVILFIYRKFVYSRDEEDKGLGEIIVSKHRNGPTGSVDISFLSRYAKFENLSRLQTDFIPDDIPV